MELGNSGFDTRVGCGLKRKPNCREGGKRLGRGRGGKRRGGVRGEKRRYVLGDRYKSGTVDVRSIARKVGAEALRTPPHAPLGYHRR
jgi:hypothetical protein